VRGLFPVRSRPVESGADQGVNLLGDLLPTPRQDNERVSGLVQPLA
jgi:hypothetical protein